MASFSIHLFNNCLYTIKLNVVDMLHYDVVHAWLSAYVHIKYIFHKDG